MNPHVATIVRKEFREFRRNKLILTTMAILPAVFLVLPLITLLSVPRAAADRLAEPIAAQALLMFLLVPVILPTTIAAYSVIGEREQGTLEPLLTTPATDQEILFAKAVSATVPGIGLAWLLFAVFLGIVGAFAPAVVRDAVVRPQNLVAVLTLAPALGVLAIEISLTVSARSSDIRVAQQLSALAVLPAIGLVGLFAYRAIVPSLGRYLLLAAAFALVDAAGWRAVTRTFDRERVLTRFGR